MGQRFWVLSAMAGAIGFVGWIAPTAARAQLQPTAQTNPLAQQPSYYIGPGDQLQISVAGYPEYSGPQIVLSDGHITLPMVGSLQAADKTPLAFSQELSAQFNTYLINPIVTVNVTNLRPITVNVAGEVMRPGPIQLRSITAASAAGTTNAGLISLQRPTLTTALLEAGGVTRNADLRNIVLKRFSPLGDRPPVTLNLWNAIVSDNTTRDLVLQDGDTLLIPKITELSDLDRRLMARSSLAPRTVRVRVMGEVKTPGEVQVSPDGTLSSALAIAGGPTTQAKLREVGFVRMLPNGQVERKEVDLRLLSDTIQIQDGDVLIVPKNGGDKALDIAGRLFGPLGLILNIFK